MPIGAGSNKVKVIQVTRINLRYARIQQAAGQSSTWLAVFASTCGSSTDDSKN